MVHARLRGRLHHGLGLRVSAGRLAVWTGRGRLVNGRFPALGRGSAFAALSPPQMFRILHSATPRCSFRTFMLPFASAETPFASSEGHPTLEP